MCSTFKVLAAAAILARVDAGNEQLTRRIIFDASALVVNSPVTEKRVGGDGMTLAEICDAALTRSDNTAGNLLLAGIGGPPGLTAFARGLGDQITRLDRDEPSLNEALPDDPRDTTTPNAMASNLQTLILGTTALSAASREQLTAWLIANKTGDTRLRAGFAKDWRIGDKTGAGDRGTNNHVAVVWPPNNAPDRNCRLSDWRHRFCRAAKRHFGFGRACGLGHDVRLGAGMQAGNCRIVDSFCEPATDFEAFFNPKLQSTSRPVAAAQLPSCSAAIRSGCCSACRC